MLTEVLLILNLMLTSSVIGYLVRGRRSETPPPQGPYLSLPVPARTSSLTPIKHEPIEAPMIPLVVTAGRIKKDGEKWVSEIAHSYYQEKGNPDAEPFIATHYREANPDQHVPFPDMYRGASTEPMPGEVFRKRFELANVAKAVGTTALGRSRAQAKAPGGPLDPRRQTVVKETHSGRQIVGVPIQRN